MDLVVSLLVTETMAQLKTVICFSALVFFCIIPSTRCQLPVLSFVDLLIPLQKYFMAGYVTFLYTKNFKTNGGFLLLFVIIITVIIEKALSLVLLRG